ncbi:hypothetical protein pb186bvf_013946 [Paramecium bursaria]
MNCFYYLNVQKFAFYTYPYSGAMSLQVKYQLIRDIYVCLSSLMDTNF